jgi:hypothetical protein
VAACGGSGYYRNSKSLDILGVIFWLFFFILLISLIFTDVNYCNVCGRSNCNCNKGSNPNLRPNDYYRVRYNANPQKTTSIQLNEFCLEPKNRQVIRMTINGTECINNNAFSCDPVGFNQTVNIALPKPCDVLLGVDPNQPLELYSWTAPSGTVFTFNYLISHRTSFITILPPVNIIATGEIDFVAQNNIEFTDISVVFQPECKSGNC